jgi:amino acid transporter
VKILDFLLGRPLASYEEEGEKIGVKQGVPMLGLDGLSSAGYGPEAALALLLPLGAAGLDYIGPITWLILGLLLILYLSYRQTITAYPTGGGSYTVAKENLGTAFGLAAAASLMVDYILNVAVGISAGVGALVSAVPSLNGHILALCLVILALVALVNLRGARESGGAFAIPTYAFVGTLAITMAIGLYKSFAAAGAPVPVEAPPPLPAATEAVSLWLLLKAFSNGCTAMTGVEAVSNGVTAFAEPRVKKAQDTLTVIIAILAALLAGIAFLCVHYHIGAMDQTDPKYQSVLSQLVAAIVGRNWFYYVTQASVLAVLALAANTSYAGFPRLCSLLAVDDYLPRSFALRGRRLVYTTGITILTVVAAVLLIIFGGITDRLIPLFAVGAFGAFTLSQAGMVMHWKRQGAMRSLLPLTINLVGAVATTAALGVILAAKFSEGAWISFFLIALLVVIFYGTHHHYAKVGEEIDCDSPMSFDEVVPPIVLVPVRGWSTITEKALRFAVSISHDVRGIFVSTSETEEEAQRLVNHWHAWVEGPLGRPLPLNVLRSELRDILGTLVGYIHQVTEDHPNATIAVIIPELVEARWYHYLLHNQRATMIKLALLFWGGPNVVTINVPWYLYRPASTFNALDDTSGKAQ